MEKLARRPVDWAVAPSANQVYVWDATNGKWTPDYVYVVYADNPITDTFDVLGTGGSSVFSVDNTGVVNISSTLNANGSTNLNGATTIAGTLAMSAANVIRTSTGSVQIGGTAARATTAGTKRLDLFDGTAPAGTLANGVSLYSAGGKLFAMDAGGTATQLTP